MKRFLNLQSTLSLAVILTGLLFVNSSFSFGPVEDAQLVGGDSQKKEQRVKVVVTVDGKGTKIDTVFNLPDQKMIDEQVDSILTKLDKGGMNCNKTIVIRSDQFRRSHGQDMKRGAHDEQFDILIQNDDSGKTCPKRKVICVRGFDNELMREDRDDDDDEMMPPPPPPMPPHVMMMHSRFGGDPFAFDTKDESVVSYEKKDLGNGLEKITIIRKKHEEKYQMKMLKAEIPDNALIKKKNDEFNTLKKLKDEAENSKK